MKFFLKSAIKITRNFLTSSASVTDFFSIEFKPKTIISDAFNAMNNVIFYLYPECKLLINWFH